MPKNLPKAFLPATILIALVLVFFWRTILLGEVNLPPNSNWDAVDSFFSLKSLASQSFHSDEWPLWNPSTYAGTPLLADVLAGGMYPLDILFYLHPTLYVYGLLLIFHLLLGCLFMYALLRTLGASYAASLISAVVFVFSGYFIIHVEHRVLTASLVWVPLILLLLEKSLCSRSLTPAVGAGLALGMMLTAVSLQVALYGFVLAFLYFVLRALSLHGTSVRKLIQASVPFICFAMVGLLISAVQWLSTLEMLPLSNRAFRSYVGWSFFDPASFFPNLIFPYLAGSQATGVHIPPTPFFDLSRLLDSPRYYIGIAPLALAAVHLFLPGGSIGKTFNLLTLLIGAFLIFIATPLERPVLELFPSLASLRHENAFFVFFLCVAVLAGLGYDSLTNTLAARAQKIRRLLARTLWAILGLLLAAFGAVTVLLALGKPLLARVGGPWLAGHGFTAEAYAGQLQYLSLSSQAVYLPLLMVGATALLFTLFFRERLKRRGFQVLLVGLIVVDLFAASYQYVVWTPAKSLYPEDQVTSFLRSASSREQFRFVPTSASPPGDLGSIIRNKVITPTDALLTRALGVPYGLQSAFGKSSLVLRWLIELTLQEKGDLDKPIRLGERKDTVELRNYDAPILDLLNVGYVISSEKLEHPKLRLVLDGKTKVYENSKALPRLFWVSNFRVVPDDEARRLVLDPAFEPLSYAPLSPDTALGVDIVPAAIPSQAKVQVLAYSNNKVSVEVEAAGPGLLVFSDSYYPGWKAFVDGTQVPVLRAYYMLKAAPVEAGQHSVTFMYDPASFKVGAAVSGVTLLLALSFLGYRGTTAILKARRRK